MVNAPPNRNKPCSKEDNPVTVTYPNWKFEVNQGLVNPHNAPNIVANLDAMIEEERQKLDALRKPQSEPSPQDKFLID